MYSFFYATTPFWPAEQLQEMNNMWSPSVDVLNKEISAMQGSWTDQNSVRFGAAFMLEVQVFLMTVFWRVMVYFWAT